MTQQNYTFGDNERASRRLGLLAEAFAQALHDFVGRAAPANTRLVVDLGCGPGHTTRALQRLLSGARIVGLEQSGSFLAEAREASRGDSQVEFLQHDVTILPFPVMDADVVYARFLLTHLTSVESLIERWAEVLAPRGRLLLQETAAMRSEHPALRRYYELVGALQGHYGQALYVGGGLEALVGNAPLRLCDVRLTRVPVSARSMAELHRLNLRTWRTDPYARRAFDPGELDRLEEELTAIADGGEPAHVEVELGELVAERR